MRGDLCPYDHGSDPVVVEDVNLPNVLGFHPIGPRANSSAPSSSSSSNANIHPPPPQLVVRMPNLAPPIRPAMASIRPPLPRNGIFIYVVSR